MSRVEDLLAYRRYLRSGKGVLLASRNCGLGDNLFAVAHAWLYCRKSGRDLIIDLCHSRFLKDPEVNAGYLFFEFPECFDGVRIENPPKISWGLRRLMHLGRIAGWVHMRLPGVAGRVEKLLSMVGLPLSLNSMELSEECERELVKDGKQRPEKFLRFRWCHFDHLSEVRAFLLSVQPSQAIRLRLTEFLSAAPAKFIGLHVRYYSEQWVEFPRYGSFWVDRGVAIQAIVDEVARSRVVHGPDCPVFLCTNDASIEHELCGLIAGVFVYPKQYGGDTAKELFDQGLENAGIDAVIEMFALKSACGLVRYPPTKSWFSELAAMSLDGGVA